MRHERTFKEEEMGTKPAGNQERDSECVVLLITRAQLKGFPLDPSPRPDEVPSPPPRPRPPSRETPPCKPAGRAPSPPPTDAPAPPAEEAANGLVDTRGADAAGKALLLKPPKGLPPPPPPEAAEDTGVVLEAKPMPMPPTATPAALPAWRAAADAAERKGLMFPTPWTVPVAMAKPSPASSSAVDELWPPLRSPALPNSPGATLVRT